MPVWSIGTVANGAKSAYIATARAFHNDVARIMPFVGVRDPGATFTQYRTTTAATPAWHAEGTAPVPTDPVLNSAAFTFQRLSHLFTLDLWTERAKNDPNDLRRMCAEIGGDGFLDRLGETIVTGAAAPSMIGLITQMDPTQILNVAPAAFTADDMRRVIEKVGTGYPGHGCDALITSARGLREMLRVLEPTRLVDWIWNDQLGKKVPHFNGIPIFVGPVPVLGGPNFNTSVIALCRSSPAGVRVLYAMTEGTDTYGRELAFLPNQQATPVNGAYITGYYALAQMPSSTGMLQDFNTSGVGNPI